MNHFDFQRPQLAVAYCDSLEGKGIANARSGLFLAGPRRVGKSTFLQHELIPEAHKRHWETVYVDLWANKNENPAHLIAEAIKAKLLLHQGKLAKLVQAINIDKINILGTIAFDLSEQTHVHPMTLTSALALLKQLTKKPIVLIIDEAQHALASNDGLNAMFSVKSARDQLNAPGDAALMLVFTGSNRDKLAHLILKKDQPFFGSDITAFPLLGKDYTDAFTLWVNKNLAPNNQFTKDSMWKAFQLIGHKPEILRQLAGRIALSGEARHFTALLEHDALIWKNRIWDEFEHDFNALTTIQRVVLELLIEKGHAWSPFSEESLSFYQQKSKQPKLATATIQAAIQTLRDRGFIWQLGRGAYALEDDGFAEWFHHHNRS